MSYSTSWFQPKRVLAATILNCRRVVVEDGGGVGVGDVAGAGGEGEEHAGLAGVGRPHQDTPDVGALGHPAPAAGGHWSTGWLEGGQAAIAPLSRDFGATAVLDRRPAGVLAGYYLAYSVIHTTPH